MSHEQDDGWDWKYWINRSNIIIPIKHAEKLAFSYSFKSVVLLLVFPSLGDPADYVELS